MAVWKTHQLAMDVHFDTCKFASETYEGGTFALPSSDPLTSSGGPRRNGQQLLTKLSCSAIFLTCSPVRASQALTVLSGDADRSRSPSGVQCSSSTAFLWPVVEVALLR